MRVRIVRLVSQCPPVGGDRLLQLALSPEGKAEIAVEGRHLPVQRNGFDNQIHRDVVAADLMSENTKQMQCVGMTGIDLQNLPIEPLCFVQSAGLVVSKGISEHVLNAR